MTMVLQDAEVGRRQHVLWVDSVRVVLIAGVIVVHAATAYLVDIAGWYYDDELTTSEPWSTLVTIPAFFGAVFALGPLFLLAGWFSAGSIGRRGPGGFARSRLLRLGVPLVVFVLLIQPLSDYVGNVRSEKGSFAYYLGHTEASVMWFAAALLAFSLVYAAWQQLGVRPAPMPFGPRLLVRAALSIAVGSFAVWIVMPLEDEMLLNLRVPAWPQGAVLFALGVHAAHGGWLTDLPRRTRRASGWTVVAASAALAAFLAVEVEPGGELATSADVPTALFALFDGVIAVAFTLWLLAWFQCRWTAPGALVERAARGSFATYCIHPLLLTAIMVAFAAVPLGAPIKFLVVSAVGVPACFATGYGLTRVPGVSSVL
jgi:hypothetical protein